MNFLPTLCVCPGQPKTSLPWVDAPLLLGTLPPNQGQARPVSSGPRAYRPEGQAQAGGEEGRLASVPCASKAISALWPVSPTAKSLPNVVFWAVII